MAVYVDPYHWAWLSEARSPFSTEIKNLVLSQLSDMNFVESLTMQLYELFSVSMCYLFLVHSGTVVDINFGE